MRRSVPAGTLLAIGLAAVGCAAADPGPRAGPRAIQAWSMRARIERIAVGQSAAEARAILGRDPVHKPGHPHDPFASPWREVSLATADGSELRLELYVVSARRADGCPDVQVEGAPVAFVDGVVAARDWDAVETRWRGWGGSLAALRLVREAPQCTAALGE